MTIHPQEAGMEVMSALMTMGFAFLVFLCWIFYHLSPIPNDRYEWPLKSSLQNFVTGVDRSATNVTKIHHLLMAHFAQMPEFEPLMTATGSFVSGGELPFLDEEALAQKFAEFLAAHCQIYLDPRKNGVQSRPSSPWR